MPKINIEGIAEIEMNSIYCVCGHCGNSDTKNAIIELNFREQRVIYRCSQCQKENIMLFGRDKPPPYPRIGIGR